MNISSRFDGKKKAKFSLKEIQSLCSHKNVFTKTGECTKCGFLIWPKICPNHKDEHMPSEMNECGWCFVAKIY